MFNSRQFYNVNRASVLTPQVRAIWDNMCIGVAVVDADGICEYMNPIQRRADGFTRIPVEGQHITSLYVPHELEVIPTMECLQTGKPLLKKAYWYATSTNFLASTVTDFFPLFDHGRKDGVIAFTIWTGNTAHVSESRRPLKPCNADTPYSYYTFSSIVGRYEALQECIHEARSAATSSSPVMIWGESGTGKELFAQAIHSASSRAGHPFIPVNCAAIPENLLEGILFGTVKGAYTDAPDKPVIFFCRSGNRTDKASDLLRSLAGDAEAWQMEGGATAWDKAGLPVVRSRRSLPMFRQIQIGAGGMVLLGLALSLAWPQWLWLSAFVGAGLVFAGVTGFCGLGLLLARMPWNKK